MADDAEWTAVSSRKKPEPQPQATTPLTKAQLKNKRRAAKRAAEARALLTVAATDDSLDAYAARAALTARAAAAATPPSTSSRRARRRSASSGDLSASEEETAPPPPSPHELVEAARRRLRKATKAERQCDDAAAKLVQTPSLAKDQGLVAKAERREGAAAAAAAARADLALAQAAVDADNAVKGARRAAAVARHHAEASQMLSVKFDDKYACAVCTEVLEAAVTTGVCEHVFCRGCLEDHCAQASKPSECVCPLCRKPLVNGESGRVEASAAALVADEEGDDTGWQIVVVHRAADVGGEGGWWDRLGRRQLLLGLGRPVWSGPVHGTSPVIYTFIYVSSCLRTSLRYTLRRLPSESRPSRTGGNLGLRQFGEKATRNNSAGTLVSGQLRHNRNFQTYCRMRFTASHRHRLEPIFRPRRSCPVVETD